MTNLTNVSERERLRVIVWANAAMVLLYWDIGRTIPEGRGARVIDPLPSDLHRGFPDMRGFSPRNLKYKNGTYGGY